ncbi:MAG: hypothetical protein ACREBV_05585 [Candidatus Zixiibacteriota bacterium]
MKSGSGTSASDKGQKQSTPKKINERDRLRYIGFDVFPGEPKDLFKSEEEKKKLVAQVRERLEHHDHLRSDCTLLEERVSGTDRIFLTIASAVIVLSLFLPWYSAYNEIVEENVPVEKIEEPVSTTAVTGEIPSGVNSDAAAGTVQTPPVAATSDTVAATAEQGGTSTTSTEELITTVMVRKKIHKEYSRLSGMGGIISIGAVASKVFSSGLALMLTALLFIGYALICIAVPIYNLYGIYGIKGDPDKKALKLKKMLRLSWLPLIIFVLGLFLSFLGGEYSFNAAEVFTSLGDSYSPLTYLGTVSWGVYVSLACFILCAAKGVEI